YFHLVPLSKLNKLISSPPVECTFSRLESIRLHLITCYKHPIVVADEVPIDILLIQESGSGCSTKIKLIDKQIFQRRNVPFKAAWINRSKLFITNNHEIIDVIIGGWITELHIKPS